MMRVKSPAGMILLDACAATIDVVRDRISLGFISSDIGIFIPLDAVMPSSQALHSVILAKTAK
jgi:hypothetical protein